MRRTVTLSTAVAILSAALGFLTSASSEVAPINISGAWEIESQNGPSPLCGFEQAGNKLTGSCTGPNANGTIIGTIIGEQVRWSWQWVTYGGNTTAAFDFIGTWRPDNTMTGMVERREIGVSKNFIAKRQSVAAGDKGNAASVPKMLLPPALGAPPAPSAPAAPAGAAPPGFNPRNAAADKRYAAMVKLYGQDNVDRAFQQFPAGANADVRGRAAFLNEGLRAALDRQQGHSYSIHVK